MWTKLVARRYTHAQRSLIISMEYFSTKFLNSGVEPNVIYIDLVKTNTLVQRPLKIHFSKLGTNGY